MSTTKLTRIGWGAFLSLWFLSLWFLTLWFLVAQPVAEASFVTEQRRDENALVRFSSMGDETGVPCYEASQDDDPLESLTEQEVHVKELFLQFRSGDYQDHRFPKLTWDDIPALLKMSGSKRELTHFPRNAISSQYEKESLEGIVALWMIEGLRAGGKYPSLNALILDRRADGGRDFEAQSRANHDRVRELYSQWWKANSMRPAEDAQRDDPLKSTPYKWY